MNLKKVNMCMEILFGRTVLSPIYRRKAKQMDIGKKDIVLDFGCGTGNSSRHIVKKAGSLVCLDTDENKIRYLKNTLKCHKNVIYTTTDIREWDYDKKFTKINVFYVLHDFRGNTLADIATRMFEMSEEGCRIHITEPKKESHGIEPELLDNAFVKAGFSKKTDKQSKNSFYTVYIKSHEIDKSSLG